ncbi:MAG: amylo-alpha-1,6-glucosidase [Pseudomonadota bacterium]
MKDRILIGDQWYIAARTARAESSPQAIKSGETFALFDRSGDIHTLGGGEQGLYHEDTRFLSKLEFSIDGVQPMFLGSTVKEGNNLLVVEMMNPDLMHGGRLVLPKGELHVFRGKLLWEGACYEHIRLNHYGREPVSFELSLKFDADFVDLFEVRGAVRARRGQRLATTRHCTPEGATMRLAYRGLDGLVRRSHVRLRPQPAVLEENEARWSVELKPQGEFHLYCEVGCEIEAADDRHSGDAPGAHGAPARAQVLRDYDSAYRLNTEARARLELRRCRIETSNPLMNSWLDRSMSDLAMLSTELPTGPYPYAGVPWYSTTFGRDGLITAREALWLDPSLARGVLAHLAATQATSTDRERDADPGKILHEARKSEMANTGEVPFGRYYGTVDATPLFVAVAGAYHQRTGDLAFIRSIWPGILAALAWMERDGDIDGDGFVDYARRSSNGLVQQGWKDSQDSVFHADGRMAQAPIALCEVQGYVYEARQYAAILAEALGDPAHALRLREQAQALRQRFLERFWCEEIGCYAIALDGDKQPCRVATSNAGHALWSGIASDEHAAHMARRFVEPDFFTGFGIRTVAAGQARYNPMSYHNGSIWPHDNALIATGLARYGHTDAALRIFNGLFDASQHFSEHRLPELFCGFPRREGEGPTLYPVACSPQAWAAASVFAMLAACLGLEIDAARACLSFRAPRLPEHLDWVRICDLRVADASVDLLLKRHHNNVGVEVIRKQGDLSVQVAM